ncbi:UDP-N-acetylmuramoylalanine--D-glutamate ligase [Candidatus Collierbacteria bacterium RIFOXYB1_FULL_49_13]|uniref:UDP-N-acetylmuramoylalanine--D-glutamate ligase n=1 Tax=Candidatus Collierbacteria bacterium RIFOXYB1_FULL_49_13 TaxID=1817728 RepID=A0A1F5FGD5_9BACT|nr:MAG: UDP-N-acetylmuramoylalanine--D-glutamate ligase [Candidatus Collierbacteria bacterium RIFOXYB1_FULL_49_13]
MEDNWKNFFKGKKVTMMGLGLLGRGIGVAKFMAKYGAELIITDLKPREKLESSVEQLEEYELQITYVFGEHRKEDFENRDMVIKSAGVPLVNEFIDHARKHGVPVEMDASLFARLVPEGVILVGITGTRGKSTVTHLIYHILKTAGKRVFLGGNVRGLATLPLLEEVRDGDYVVLELDSWQLQGFGEAKISPQIAVFTNLMPDHMNYYKNDMERYFEDKANIFLYQGKEDTLVAGSEILDKIKSKYGDKLKGRVVEVVDGLPSEWELSLAGVHNRYNAALAVGAGRALGISEDLLVKAVGTFKPVEGRLEYMGEINGVRIYNDNNATTPEATVAGLEAVAKGKNVILIMGGADKGLDMSGLVVAIKKYCWGVLLLSGTGTERVKGDIKSTGDLVTRENEKLEELVTEAFKLAKSGDVILFSPALASFSQYFQNEYERNDLFVGCVRKKLV